MSVMSVQEVVRRLSREKRTLLCNELIEIILGSKKDGIPNELVADILDFWKTNQLITTEKTLGLVQASFRQNPIATRLLLNRLDLNPLFQVIEADLIVES